MSSIQEQVAQYYKQKGDLRAAMQARSNAMAQRAHESSARGDHRSESLSELELAFQHLASSFERVDPSNQEAYSEWKAAVKEFFEQRNVQADKKVAHLCQELMKQHNIQ